MILEKPKTGHIWCGQNDNTNKGVLQTKLEKRGQTFVEYQKEFEGNPWHTNVAITAIETKINNRILAGHDLSKNWLSVMRIVEDGNREECGVPETGKHQLLYCKKLTKEKEEQSNITEEIFKAHWKDKTGK